MLVDSARIVLKLYPLIISTTIGRSQDALKTVVPSLQRSSRTTSTESNNFCSKMDAGKCSSDSPEDILEVIKSFIPPLTHDQYKGQSGRIGVIGGSEEYTGAPYFSAIAALKLGADLAHVFCTKSAAPVIKSYSPELIVHPLLDDKDALQKIKEWIPRLHAVVIGPGLGRERSTLSTVSSIMRTLKEQNKPLVIDADGLFMVTNNVDVVKGYKNAILTPNQVEFKRLIDAIGLDSESYESDHELTASVSKSLGGLVIARKMHQDIISDGQSVLQVMEKGSPRRCGGQGDLLSGAAAVFFHWALKHEVSHKGSAHQSGHRPGVMSAYAACLLSKLCAEAAFEKMGRSTTTTDLISEIHNVFSHHFETYPHKL